MGVVCKAEDIRLKRMVALKFLPAHLTEDKARRERLLLEARAASRLDHANICTIHEIEETGDGQIVLVMAYYEGETLSQRIERGRMELGQAVEVASGILRGLQHAHQRGVIHRDIKPSNVILTGEGDVKIRSDAGHRGLSSAGGVAGAGDGSSRRSVVERRRFLRDAGRRATL
jgi:non-specific serine/threonine protein kinase